MSDPNANYVRSFDTVFAAEKKRIGTESEDARLVGLAISGGGIRSASFGLGVLQALVNQGLLKRFDYLSTVSGGGYIGSCLTWFLQQGIPGKGGVHPAGTDESNFPLGGRDQPGARQDEDGGRNSVLNYIRQHGNYLMPGQGLDLSSLIAVALRGMLVSLAFYFTMLTGLMVVLKLVGFFEPVRDSGPAWLNVGEALAIVLLGLFALGSFGYALLTYWTTAVRNKYRWRTQAQKQLGRVLTVAVVAAAAGSISLVEGALEEWYWSATASGGLMASGVLSGLLDHFRSVSAKASKMPGVVPALGALALIYGLLLGSYFVASLILAPRDASTTIHVVWWSFFAVMAAVGWFVNTNYLGPQRMYRDRLMETFLPDADSVLDNHWGLATKSDATCIDRVCRTHPRPYHLVNANIVLADSHVAKYRGRAGDSFLLSPLFCGSDSTGWRRSDDFMGAKKNQRGMTLATAMAISGAALNPNAGVAGRGATTNRFVSTLLSVLNLRLGYWIPNPIRASVSHKANLWVPGLRGGVFSGGLDEKRTWVELSDGGHFENLGIYELVRRRTDVIVASDAGADPDFNFGDLANAVERCRVDFNAIIVIPSGVVPDTDEERPLTDLIPGSGPATTLRYGLAKNGYALGEIRYPATDNDAAKTGVFVYLKTTMTSNLSADVYGYKNDHTEFPDQSTADQFFDEVQLEAYRELGYALAKQMCIESGSLIDPNRAPPALDLAREQKPAKPGKKKATKKKSGRAAKRPRKSETDGRSRGVAG